MLNKILITLDCLEMYQMQNQILLEMKYMQKMCITDPVYSEK